MDIYRYFAENEKIMLVFLFTYRPSKEEFFLNLKESLGYEPYIYYIFPDPNQETVLLEDILSVLTSNGKELFIPAGLKVEYFDQVRVLFGEPEL